MSERNVEYWGNLSNWTVPDLLDLLGVLQMSERNIEPNEELTDLVLEHLSPNAYAREPFPMHFMPTVHTGDILEGSLRVELVGTRDSLHLKRFPFRCNQCERAAYIDLVEDLGLTGEEGVEDVFDTLSPLALVTGFRTQAHEMECLAEVLRTWEKTEAIQTAAFWGDRGQAVRACFDQRNANTLVFSSEGFAHRVLASMYPPIYSVAKSIAQLSEDLRIRPIYLNDTENHWMWMGELGSTDSMVSAHTRPVKGDVHMLVNEPSAVVRVAQGAVKVSVECHPDDHPAMGQIKSVNAYNAVAFVVTDPERGIRILGI